jgi:hypothetical protein
MKMVEFTRDMRPQRAGEKRVVPDAVAEKLIATGDAKPVVSAFDKPSKPPVVTGRTYKTRKRA